MPSKEMAVSAIEDFLRQMVSAREIFADKTPRPPDFQYLCMEDFILREGYLMGNRSPRSDRLRRGRPKECYHNAYLLALSNPRLIYCEGYAVSGNVPLPVAHAWCIDEKGNVIDPTWKDGRSYYGVPFKIAYVSEKNRSKKNYGIIDNWEHKWPLLRGEEHHGILSKKTVASENTEGEEARIS